MEGVYKTRSQKVFEMINKQFNMFTKIISFIFLFIFSSSFRKIYFFKKNIVKRQNYNFQHQTEGSFCIKFSNGLNVICRDSTYSDYQVFNQIFVEKEYKFISDFMRFHRVEFPIIIDCGANVGYTSLFFFKAFYPAKIFAIEPSTENCAMIKSNIALNNYEDNFELMCYGIHSVDGKFLDLNNDFRDGKDWAFTTSPTNKVTSLKAITIDKIIKDYNLVFVDFIKMDIEGAEQFVFESIESCSFLKVTKIISIEVHEEFVLKSKIENILEYYNFMTLECGELTIGINKNFF
ncbi:Methyltransferase FkbM [Flavobacteriaceae bacterium]